MEEVELVEHVEEEVQHVEEEVQHVEEEVQHVEEEVHHVEVEMQHVDKRERDHVNRFNCFFLGSDRIRILHDLYTIFKTGWIRIRFHLLKNIQRD